jgi:hypothetical protein
MPNLLSRCLTPFFERWSRFQVFTVLIVVGILFPCVISGQVAAGHTISSESTIWIPSRTPWGDPDLQGVWNNTVNVPLQRPEALAGQEFLTEEVVASREARRDAERVPRAGDTGTYNNFWRDDRILSTRTALIANPIDGRVPALTPEGQRREVSRAGVRNGRGPSDSWEDRNKWERCLTRGLPMFPGSYNNNFQFLQIPGHVVIILEMVHDVRVIPLDGRPHASIPQWLGDSRAHWEGDTLVIDTISFNGELDGGSMLPAHTGNLFQHHGSGETLHLIERFTRANENTMSYEFTITDSVTYTKPWTAIVPMVKVDDPIYEYACHEGNRGLPGILRGGRVDDLVGNRDLGGGSWIAGR